MKSSIKLIGMTAAIVVFFTGLSFGGHHNMGKNGYKDKTGPMNLDFKSIDTDQNGKMAFEEYQAAFPSSSRNGFNSLDKDGNGTLSDAEWQMFVKMHSGMGGGEYKKQPTHSYHGEKMADLNAYNAHFGDMDTDGNDAVTMTEFDLFFPNGKKNAQTFGAIDTDKNATIDHDEWHRFKEANGLRHHD